MAGLCETFYAPVHKLHPVDLAKIPGAPGRCAPLPGTWLWAAARAAATNGGRVAHALRRAGGKPTVALVETLCIGCHAVNRGAVQPGEWVLIVGAGPVDPSLWHVSIDQ
jgi:hypothetical protein